MTRKKIAVIGGGGAGATAAWALRNVHDVTLLESEESLGGHAHSPTFVQDGQTVCVDMGVEFFTEKTSPNTMALFEHFQIPTFVAPLSFSATFGSGMFWSNTHDHGTLWPHLRDECNRWHKDMHEVMHVMDGRMKQLTIGQFLAEKGYSEGFFQKALRPLLTTFSSCKAPLKDYSLTFAAFSFNLGLLSFFHPSYWRKAVGGMGAYLKCIQETLGERVHCGARVQKVTPHKGQISVYVQNQEHVFDHVVFAVHADQALQLLHAPTQQQTEILRAFQYTSIISVCHRDQRILTSSGPTCPYIQYKNTHADTPESGSLTRVLNHLDGYRHLKDPLLVTFDPHQEIAPEQILTRKNWKIPLLRPQDMLTKKRMGKLQGHAGLWFCGTDTSFTGHEGAVVSGLVVAERLGAPYPFPSNPWAKIQLDLAKGLMGLYPPSAILSRLGGDFIFKLSKILGLQASQIPRVLLELYA